MDQTENRGPLIIGFVIAFIVISVVIVSLRFWVRYRSNAGLWWDDYVALIALLSVTASNCTRFWCEYASVVNQLPLTDLTSCS